MFIACGQKQRADTRFNFNFEQVENGKPTSWYYWDANPNYTVTLDSIRAKSGKYSMSIQFSGDSIHFGTFLLALPDNYDGEKITLSGYIKTENVTDGFAGLLMRIDPLIAFDNMYRRGVSGTTNWTKYEITLDMKPSDTKQIVIGGLLAGKGKAWFDDFKITIDGTEIQYLTSYQQRILPAEKDSEFDAGSSIFFPMLHKQRIEDLELLGKIWGFLKYHHPAIAKGNYNWDYELFRILPAFFNVNITERDSILLDWINQYGDISICTTCKDTSPEAFLKPDLAWTDNSNINQKLKEKLQYIYSNRHQGEQFYIKMFPGIGYPQFLNENSYSKRSYPDEGFRLLALYRYWNMIHYFYPNKYLTNKNWNEVLEEYIPRFILAKNELEYELAVLRLIGEISDTHAVIGAGGNKIQYLRGGLYAPFKVQFIENKLIVTEYFNVKLQEADNPKIGDIITHINGKTVEALIDSIKGYYPASNDVVRMRDMVRDLCRSKQSSIHITYISFPDHRTVEKELKLYFEKKIHAYKIDTEKCYKFLDGNIGYITLKSIKDEDVTDIKKAFRSTKGIIIDIRNYPSANVLYSLGSFFVSSSTPFVKCTQGNVNNPGEFTFTPALEIPESEETYQGKLVVIVNEETQSAAEFEAMAFRVGDNTSIIGSTTAGADGNVSEIVLPGGLKTWISGIGIYYPDGRETQRVGIVPDIEVKPTIKGIREGRDEVLEKAIEIIQQNKIK
jgi:C-terminal processing protease CtpA/Prc